MATLQQDLHAITTPLTPLDRIRDMAGQVGYDLPPRALEVVDARYRTWTDLQNQNWTAEARIEKRRALDDSTRAALAKIEQQLAETDATEKVLNDEIAMHRKASSLLLSDDEVSSVRAFPELKHIISERTAREQAGTMLLGIIATINATDDPDTLLDLYAETELTEHAGLIRNVGRVIGAKLRAGETSSGRASAQAATFRGRFTTWGRAHPSSAQRIEALTKQRDAHIAARQRGMAWLRQAAAL